MTAFDSVLSRALKTVAGAVAGAGIDAGVDAGAGLPKGSDQLSSSVEQDRRHRLMDGLDLQLCQ